MTRFKLLKFKSQGSAYNIMSAIRGCDDNIDDSDRFKRQFTERFRWIVFGTQDLHGNVNKRRVSSGDLEVIKELLTGKNETSIHYVTHLYNAFKEHEICLHPIWGSKKKAEAIKKMLRVKAWQ